MKHLFSLFIVSIAVLALSFGLFAEEATKKNEAAEAAAAKCPICDKPVNPNCAVEYEGKTHAFATGECRKKWTAEREASLYHRIGGKAAISAAVDLFYTKVLADESVNFFFEDVSMKRQHNKQKAFLSAALGGPEPWTGKDMRTAHASLDLKESHFNAIAGHLLATLEELEVKKELIDQVMAIVGSTRDDVLNREKKATE